jgi:hypothetical protein
MPIRLNAYFDAPTSIRATLVDAATAVNWQTQASGGQRDARPGAVPGGVIAILAASSAALAFSSYLPCHDARHFPLVTALIARTAGQFVGCRRPSALGVVT